MKHRAIQQQVLIEHETLAHVVSALRNTMSWHTDGPGFSRKLHAIQAYATQLSPQDASDTGRHFLFRADLEQRVITKDRYHGESIGAEYGEPFLSEGPVSADCPLLAMLAAAPPTGAGTE